MVKYFLELKNRLLLLLSTSLSIFLIAYVYKETILFSIVAQQEGTLFKQSMKVPLFYFIFTNVTELFMVYIQVIAFIVNQISFFYFVHHVFMFLKFASFEAEYNFFNFFFKTLAFVWFFSLLLVNFFIIPSTWDFFMSFQNLLSQKFTCLHFEAKLNEYLNFYIAMYYLFIVYCQIFTIFFFSFFYAKNKVKIVKKFRKLYYYFFVMFSTCVSPPDVFSQIFLSAAIIGCCEILTIVFILYNILIFNR